jgi:hypothetical protein
MIDDNKNNLALFSEDRFEPCRVCGEPSSGWHCGAVTCEACKVNFNKISQKQIEFKYFSNIFLKKKEILSAQSRRRA